MGAVLNTSKVKFGSTVAVFGLGGVGLSCVQGARMAGASRIIAIDTNPGKYDLAKKFGATDCVNPKALPSGKTIVDAIVEMTDGGVDYSFEAIGSPATMRQALVYTHHSLICSDSYSVVIGMCTQRLG